VGAVFEGGGFDPASGGGVPKQVVVGGGVSMTAVRPLALMVRSYRLVSWWTSTAAIVSARVLPVLVSVASTFSPGFRDEMGTALPLAREHQK